MSLRLIAFVAVTVVLYAEDVPKSVVEQLQARIADQERQIVKLQQKLTFYRNVSGNCQDALLDAQIDAQAKQQQKPDSK